MPTQVAVVILNYNGRDYLEKFLPFVVQNSQPYEIIVADNASTDNSVEFLEKEYPQLRLIKLVENTGYAGGYQNALSQIDADYFVLLNSDIEVTANWIEPVISLMDKDPEVIACQPKIKSYHQKTHFEYAGAAGGFIDYLGYPFCRGRIFSTAEQDEGQYDDDKEIFWATGACLFVKAEPFFALGGLDATFFAHMEEIDFCWRAKNQGYKIYYCGKSTVYHVGGGTLNAESPYKTYLNFRNNLLMLYKNLSTVEFQQVYQKRVSLDVLAGIQLFLSGKSKNAKSIYKAYTDFKKLKTQYNPSTKFGLIHNEIYQESIVKSYFLKGMKKFSQLKLF